MLTSSGVRVTLLAVAVILGSLAIAGATPAGGASSASEFVYVTSSTTPEQPIAGEEFAFTLTFNSVDRNSESITVDRIEVRDGPGSDADVLAERSYFGGDRPTVSPGGSLDQAFDVEFDSPGTHEVVVRATVTVGGKRSTVDYRMDVDVYEQAPRIEADAEPTTAGERTTMRVTAANGLDRDVRDVELSVAADGVSFDERSRVASSIAAGDSESFSFTATPETLGTHSVEATLEYTTTNGTRRTVIRTLDVPFRSADHDSQLGVAADVASAMPGGETTLNLSVANGFDQPLRQLQVEVAPENATVKQPRRVGTGLESGTQQTFTFDVTRPNLGQETIDVTLSYTTEDGSKGTVTETLTTTFDTPTNPGEIILTGVDAVAREGTLEVSATASNVGSTDVESVIVSIGDTPGVASADYFVGEVEGSDFASFTLETAVTGNVSSVPVVVTYDVDGVEQSVTTDVPVQQANVERPDGSGGGSLPILPAVGVLVIVGALAVGYRRRG